MVADLNLAEQSRLLQRWALVGGRPPVSPPRRAPLPCRVNSLPPRSGCGRRCRPLLPSSPRLSARRCGPDMVREDGSRVAGRSRLDRRLRQLLRRSGHRPQFTPPEALAHRSSAICERAASMSSALVLACPASPHPPSTASVSSTQVRSDSDASPLASAINSVK